MSADNWTTCPRCTDNRELEIAELDQKVSESYGHISMDEFDKMRLALTERMNARLSDTFREDYEFYGANEGIVSWDYSGYCTVCGLKVSFKGSKPFYGTSL